MELGLSPCTPDALLLLSDLVPQHGQARVRIHGAPAACAAVEVGRHDALQGLGKLTLRVAIAFFWVNDYGSRLSPSVRETEL